MSLSFIVISSISLKYGLSVLWLTAVLPMQFWWLWVVPFGLERVVQPLVWCSAPFAEALF
jgi:hypothetical protein